MTPDQITAQGDRRDLFNARLKDLGNILGGDTVDAEKDYRTRHTTDGLLAKRNTAAQALMQAMTPTKASPMGPTMSGDPMGNPGHKPTIDEIMPALMGYGNAGGDTKPYFDALDAQKPTQNFSYIPLAGGGIGKFDKTTGETSIVREPTVLKTIGNGQSLYDVGRGKTVASVAQKFAPRAPGKASGSPWTKNWGQ